MKCSMNPLVVATGALDGGGTSILSGSTGVSSGRSWTESRRNHTEFPSPEVGETLKPEPTALSKASRLKVCESAPVLSFWEELLPELFFFALQARNGAGTNAGPGNKPWRNSPRSENVHYPLPPFPAFNLDPGWLLVRG